MVKRTLKTDVNLKLLATWPEMKVLWFSHGFPEQPGVQKKPSKRGRKKKPST